MTDLITPPTCLRIAQLSDFHLTGRIGHAPSYHRFLKVLDLAKAHQPDLWLLTGDLVNDGNSEAYDWLFAQFSDFGAPYFAIAGNHDVTHEIGIGLPYDQRLHLPLTPDARLLDCHHHKLDTVSWQLLMLNSAISSQTHGAITASALTWLDQTLQQDTSPALIALHHHPLPVGSAWIDALALSNTDDFWKIIDKHPHVQAIVCGHVHQAWQLQPAISHPVKLLTCPSTDRQFAPQIQTFAIDDIAAGFRMIQIDNTGALSSYIKRLQNTC